MTKNKVLLLKEFAMIIPSVIVALIPPPEGLTPVSMKFIGLFLWTVLNWSIPVMPSFITGLLLMIASVLFGIVPFKTAFSPFASSTVWLIIGAFVLGNAVSKTGLLSRLSFLIMSIFPASFRGQVAGLLGAGLIIGPLMPSTTAKVSIAGGFSTKIAELLGFENRSRGMNGIYAAMYTGFSLLAATFITSSFYSYLILGAIPAEDAQSFNFVSWFAAMIPWSIFTLIFSYLAIIFLYHPQNEKSLKKEDLRKLSADFGPMSRDEKITLIVLLSCIICWTLEKVIGIPAVLTALLGMAVLFITKVFNPKEISNAPSWGIIIFAASVISLSPMAAAAGINSWMSVHLTNIMSSVGSNPYVFIFAVALLVILCRFVLVSGTTAISLIVVILIPFCQAAGMSTWIGGIVAYTVAQPFFFKYQNPNFLIGFSAAGGDEKISFQHMIPYCFIFHIISIAGLLLSIPYWQYLGIIR